MQYTSLNDNYSGVRLSINTFPKSLTPEINAMLREYVDTRDNPTPARDALARKIVLELKNGRGTGIL